MKKFYITCFLPIVLLFLSSCYLAKRAGLKSMLNATSSRQAYESGKLKDIHYKNDSLQNKGVIYDSVYTDINRQIREHQTRIDTLNPTIDLLHQKVDLHTTYRKERKYLGPEIRRVHRLVVENAAEKDSFFRSLENRLSEADLSGENDRLGGILKSAAKQQEKDAAKVSQIGNTKDSLHAAGKVDDSTSAKLDTRLQNYKHRMDSIGTEIKTLGGQLNSPVEFKKDFALIKRKILLIDSVVNKSASTREYAFSMIMESINNSTPNLFSLAAFFGPGGYIIPEEKYELAYSYFSPIIDSLIKFSNKYEMITRTSGIIVNGYADASRINPGSKLYKTLAEYLHKAKPRREELNAALSALRAEEISRVLLTVVKQKAPEFKSYVKITFETIEAGYGEKLPDPKINNYKVNDDRRRIVIVYWNVMPGE
jgi:hypothetical protein